MGRSAELPMGQSAMAFHTPIIFLAITIVCSFSRGGAATVYTVGDNVGWDISADLDLWLRNKTFAVGDVLSFQYSSYHSVAEVDEDGFYNCTTANAIQTSSNGSTEITIQTGGHKYFICPIPSHCFGGMRMHIHVGADDAPPPQTPPGGGDGSEFPDFNSGGGAPCTAATWLRVVAFVLSMALIRNF